MTQKSASTYFHCGPKMISLLPNSSAAVYAYFAYAIIKRYYLPCVFRHVCACVSLTHAFSQPSHRNFCFTGGTMPTSAPTEIPEDT